MSQKKKLKNTPQPSCSAKQQVPQDRTWIIFCVAICVVLLIAAIIAVLPKPTEKDKPYTPYVDALEENQRYYAAIDIAEYGVITVELDHTQAPITVENFVTLANNGFYDGTSFHRVIKDFMMQGGGTSIPEKEPDCIVGEFQANGYDNNITHKRGVISMARTNVYDSATSQFFIMQVTKTHLDGNYAAFGHVVEGIEVVDAICDTLTPADDNGSIPVLDRPVINSVTITVETIS